MSVAQATGSPTYDDLTEKEKEALRLMVRGHDAKSMARELSLSVHTINDRLRSARRKLGVTSSREAARLVFEHEGDTPENNAPQSLGDECERETTEHASSQARPVSTLARHSQLVVAIGGISMVSILALFAVTMMQPAATPAAQDTLVEYPAAEPEDAEAIARVWLDLVDGEGFDTTTAIVHDDRNFEGWNKLVERRAEFGRALEREAQRVDIVDRAGTDEVIIHFRTDFERFRGAYEMVTLSYVGGAISRWVTKSAR